MGRIGNFGKLIVFETSDSRILNFTDYQRTISANWAKHERIGKKPQSEFLNPELMTVQFKVVLNAQHGVKPWKTFHEITKAVQQGRVEKLVIGNHAVGSNRWKITQATQSNLVVMGTGEIQKMDVNLSLEEYLREGSGMTIDLKHITVAFDYASGDIADIKRCLECLYQTAEGTCPLDREFGLNTDFVGMPMDVAKSQFAVEIIDKTDRYEPRATVKDINFSFNEDGQLQAEVVITNV